MKLTDMWFETAKTGEISLVLADGRRFLFEEELSVYADLPYAREGLIRSLLFTQANPVRDDKLFQNNFNTIYGYAVREEYKDRCDKLSMPAGLLIMALPYFETEICSPFSSYPEFDDLDVDEIHEAVDRFYASVDTQCRWQRLLLFPVVLSVETDGSLAPFDLTAVSFGDDIKSMCDVFPVKEVKEFIGLIKDRFCIAEALTDKNSPDEVTEEELMDLNAWVRSILKK